MTVFAITGRCHAAPPDAAWREQLTGMLGVQPRRIGTWAELGLYGALRCMADAGEATLPQDAMLMLSSQRGTHVATAAVLAQARDELPMPLAFLQTQPSQLLALLAAQLAWTGNACFLAGTPATDLLRLAAAQAGADGMLIGWLDEGETVASHWLRLRRCTADGHGFMPASPEAIFSPEVSHLRLMATGLQIRTRQDVTKLNAASDE